MRAQTNASRLPRTALLTILRAYKYAISPRLLPACRYVPTCSDYAAEAVERHGAVRGAMMAAWRLLRCHPFAKGGFDPVPNDRDRTELEADPFRGQECPRHNWRAAPTPPEAAH